MSDPSVWQTKARVEAMHSDFPHLDISSPSFDLFAYGARVQGMLRDAGIPISPIPITWSNLTCSVPVQSPQRAIATVVSGCSAAAANLKHGFARLMPHHSSTHVSDKLPDANVLSNVSGYLRPGELCLVVGSSGSGVSLLLSRLAGRKPPRLIHSDGTVLYQGEEHPAGIRPEHIVHFVSQDDTHIPQLTVRQTLQFAAACNWPSFLPHAEQLRHNDVVLTARILGIERTLDTIVGSEILRGVSGGERKRVTIGEMTTGVMGGPVIMDNWSKGLDSATTLSITTALRNYADLLEGSAVVSMQAPGSEVYKLFDTVCLLHEGRVLYFGPRSETESYLTSLGFTRPPHRSVPDFVATITDPHFREEYVSSKDSDVPALPAPPETAAEFAERFEASPYFSQVNEAISELNEQPHIEFPPGSEQLIKIGQKSTLQWPRHQLSAMIRRQKNFLFSVRRSVLTDMFQNLFLGIILGSIFWQLPNTLGGANSRGGIVFLSLIFIALSSLSKVLERYEEKVVFTKQRSAGFFDAWTYLLSQAVFDFLLELVKTACLFLPLYVMSGLNLGSSAQRLLYAILVATFTSLIMISLIRFLVGLFDDSEVAQGIAGLFTILMILTAGYLKNGSDLQEYIVWIYWANPFHYAFEALLINEYDGLIFECAPDELLPFNPSLPIESRICPVVDGTQFLEAFRGITNGKIFRLYYFLAVVGFNVLFFLLSALSTALAREKGFARKSSGNESSSPSKEVKLQVESQSSNSNTSFSFTNLVYSVEGGSRVLLDNVTGNTVSGKVVLLMGESGAGKTTLLDVCAMRKTLTGGASVSGDIRINGRMVTKEELAHSSGYCEQMDLHVLEATVFEAILFSANLRLPKSISKEEKMTRTQNTITMLGLEQYSSLLVKGLGSGELKLLTMALEVVADPKVLFLDEPTSGLHSSAAITVATALRKIADSGTAVICTIHQPSAEVFAMFDRLLLLKRGGRTVYFGDIGEDACELQEYFESHGAKERGEDENPASWMLDVIAEGAQDWHALWNGSEERRRADEETISFASLEEEGEVVDQDSEKSNIGKEVPSMGAQVSLVVRRQFLRYWRLPEYNLTRILLNFMVALMIGILFLQEVDDSQQGANLAGAALFLTIVPASLAAQNVIPPTVVGRSVFYRETASGTYKAFAYHAAVGITELPFTFVATTVFAVVFYFLVGLDSGRFLYFFIAAQLVYIMSVNFGIMLASVLPSAAVAVNAEATVFSVMQVLSGFFITKPQMPVWWRWTVWINPFAYYLGGVITNELSGQKYECETSELLRFTVNREDFSDCESIPNDVVGQTYEEVVAVGDSTSITCAFCPTPNGEVIIDRFGSDDVNKWVALAAIGGAIVFFRLVAGYGFAKLRFLTR